MQGLLEILLPALHLVAADVFDHAAGQEANAVLVAELHRLDCHRLVVVAAHLYIKLAHLLPRMIDAQAALAFFTVMSEYTGQSHVMPWSGCVIQKF